MTIRINAWVVSLGLLFAAGASVVLAQNKPEESAKPTPASPDKLDLKPPPGDKDKPAAEKPAPAKPGQAAATITVQVPANASIWIEDQQMKQTGTQRSFQSPPLEPGKTYYYKIKVSWPIVPGQRDYVSEQEITVKAGTNSVIDFRGLANPGMGTPTFSAPPQRNFRPTFRLPEGSGYR